PDVLWRLLAAPDGFCGCLQFVVWYRHVPRPVGVVRVGQPIPCIDFASEVIKSGLCQVAWWFDVQALTRGWFHPWRDKVQFMVSSMGMTYPQNVVLVRL